MKIHCIVNARAGSALGADGSRIRGELLAAFSRQGHTLTFEMVGPEALHAALSRAALQDYDALLAGGGDGTVRAAARILIGRPMALGILPLGTMNRLARDLRIPLTLAGAASALAQSNPARIDVADVNGRLFLCNSLLGLPTAFSAQRQTLRGKPAAVRLRGYWQVVRDMLRARRRLAINVDNGQTRLRLRAMSLIVSNNPYCEEPSLMLSRQRIDGGQLAVYISRHSTGWRVLRAMLGAMLGRFRSDTDVIHLDGHEVVVESKRPVLKLSNDGELEQVETPLRYTIRPKALSVLLPQPA